MTSKVRRKSLFGIIKSLFSIVDRSVYSALLMPKTRTLFDNVRADVRPQFNTFLTFDPRFLHIATTFEFPFIFYFSPTLYWNVSNLYPAFRSRKSIKLWWSKFKINLRGKINPNRKSAWFFIDSRETLCVRGKFWRETFKSILRFFPSNAIIARVRCECGSRHISCSNSNARFDIIAVSKIT